MKEFKILAIIFLAIGFVDGRAAMSTRCRRAVGRCTMENGTVINYETCTQVCCGKQIVDIENSFSSCCGDKSFGEMYNIQTQICCQWDPTLDYALYNRTENSPTEPKCCGPDLFDNEADPHTQCCSSWRNRPEAFNTLTSMCCDGRVGFITSTAYANCCHDVAYDRRTSSCPCENGKVVPATKEETSCCRFGDSRENWEPYRHATQGCCDGEVYDLELQICCNGIVANASTQYCCNGLLVEQDPGNEGNVNIGCCTVGGTEQLYDSSIQTCCGGVLVDTDTEGDSCCGNRAYFQDGGNCCNNTVYDRNTEGDGCCAGSPFDERTGVCCGESVVGTDMKWPACCSTQSFDAYEQTCCGAQVFDNPLDSGGEVSHHTRCCGDFGDPSSLLPYDYDSQTCCNGVITSLTGQDGRTIDQNSLECCGDGAMNRLTHLCCDNVINRNLFKEFGRCDGNATYDIRTSIFCEEGVRLANPYGANGICCGPNVFDGAEFADTECCGDNSMDADTFKCCDGQPRELGVIPKDKAVCCGDGCIDGRDYWCCEGRAYWKGENNEQAGDLVEGLACSEFFRQPVLDRNPGREEELRRLGVFTTTTPSTAATEPSPPPRPRPGR